MNELHQSRLGRFIVRSRGITHQFLAAHEALTLVEREDDFDEILRVHRVYDDAKMDLIGVSIESLRDRDGLILLRASVKDARRDYDALATCAAQLPPPCRIETRMCYLKDHPQATHAAILVFPAACGEGVGQWLNAAGFKSDAEIDASPGHLRNVESAVTQVILSMTLEPSPAAV